MGSVLTPSLYSAKLGHLPGVNALLTGLVSYWKLDESSGQRNDSVGTNHLTDNNTVTSVTGVINNAAQFTAANTENLSRAHEATLATTGNFTFAGWFKIDATTGISQMAIDKSDPTTGGYRFAITSALGLQFFIQNGGDQDFLSVAPGQFPLGSFHFVVAWHDADADTINLQVNNGTVSSLGTGGTTPAYDPTIVLRVGGRSTDSASPWNGSMDEIGLWHRVLTAPERTELYNAGAGKTYPF